MPPIEPSSSAEPPDVVPVNVPQSDAPVVRGGEPDAAAPTRQRTTNRSGKAKQPRSSSPVLSLLLTLSVASAVSMAAIGGYKLFGMARAYVNGQERYRISVREIEVTPPPAWVHGDLLTDVQQLAGLPDTLNTLDEQLSQALHGAFATHPWVREVVEVRVSRPAQVRVKLTYREPVAAVHTTRSLEAVDRDGVLLPNLGMADPEAYLTITGVRSTPSGPAGTKWDDTALAAGIAVADALAPHHHALGITTVDVSGFRPGNTNSGSIFLLTEHGTRVKWGRPPKADYPGEVTVQDKIDRLSKYASDNGSLDAPAGPYDIDITHWQEISLRPRSQSPTRTR